MITITSKDSTGCVSVRLINPAHIAVVSKPRDNDRWTKYVSIFVSDLGWINDVEESFEDIAAQIAKDKDTMEKGS